MAGTDIRVRTLDADGAARWDAFVEAHPETTFFHRAGWRRVVEHGFGHAAHFLYAESGGVVAGVLPLIHRKSRLFGDALISTLGCVYGGPVADDARIRRALDDRALALAGTLGVGHLEYRCRAPLHPDWPRNDSLYATFRKRLDPDPEKNLLAVPRKQRAMVRKGIKAGLESTVGGDVDGFYRLYAESVRNLGTPVFPRRYFRALAEVFGDDCEILTVSGQGRAYAAVMSFFFRDEVLPYYAGSTEGARARAANDFMYWELMRRSCERGCRLFDFGRSKAGTGAFAFKKHWGFTPEALHYEYRLFRGNEIPTINPLNPRYRAFIALWKRLPLPVANLIGPILARDLG